MNKRCRLLLLSSVFGLAAVPAPSLAQEDENETTVPQSASDNAPIVVTGSRVVREDLSSNSPLTTIDGDRLTLSAQTNIVRELQTLPSFTPSRSPVDGGSSGFTGSFLDLRGLGRGRTLTLVNGRRWINTISDGGVDVSTIPPELVERVEVVTGGASATYGSDAVAGVVNIILRRDFDGLEVNAQTGFTEDESTNSRISLTGGSDLGSNRGNAYFHVSYDRTNEISGANRDFLNPLVFNEDGQFVPEALAVAGSSTILLDPEGTQAALFRNGEAFDAAGAPLLLPAGQFFNRGAFARVQAPSDRYQVLGGIEYEIFDGVRIYAEGTYIREEVGITIAPDIRDLSGFEIPLNNPFIGPNTQAVLGALDGDGDGIVRIPGLFRRFDELGPGIENNDRDSFRIMAGFEVDLGDGWKLDTYGIYSESNFTIEFGNYTDDTRLAAALGGCQVASVGVQPCVPLNIFSEGEISEEAADFIRSNGRFRGNNTDTTLLSSLTGNLFTLPAGPVGFAVGLEYRENKASENPDDILRFGNGSIPILTQFSAALEQREVFGEALIPILSDQPFAETLGLELGVRYTDFNPGEDAWTYKVLAEWAPIRQIRFRGGFQRATRAPNAFELGGGDQDVDTLNGIGGDPCFIGAPLTGDLRAACIANGVPTAIADAGALLPGGTEFRLTFFGNPNLAPETADTITIGAVISDLPFEGLNLTVDYYHIEIDGLITSVGTGIILSECFDSGTGGASSLCDEITRNPATGVITAFDDGPVNAGGLELSGIDFGLDYAFDFGGIGSTGAQLRLSFVASYLDEFVITPFAGDPEFNFDCAGLYGASACFTPRADFQTSTNITYVEGAFTAALTWDYIGPIEDDATRLDPATAQELARTRIGSRHYFDLDARWRINDMFEIRGGIENLFDTKPPIIGFDRADSSDNNTLPGLYDAVGRRFFVGATVRF